VPILAVKLYEVAKDGGGKPHLCPDLLAGLQIKSMILKSKDDELPEEISAAWEDGALDDHGRAEAVFLARNMGKNIVLAWFLRHQRFPTPAVLGMINSKSMGPGFDKFFFGCIDVTVDVIAAAIVHFVPFDDLQKLLLNLLELGGPALASSALACGYQLEFPEEIDCIWPYLPYLDGAFLDYCKSFRVDTRLVGLLLAIETKDLQLLETALTDVNCDAFVLRLMGQAIKGSWAPGVRLIAGRWTPNVRYSVQDVVDELNVALQCVGAPDMDCYDILFGLGEPWPDCAFFTVLSNRYFDVVARGLQKGALRHSNSLGMWHSNVTGRLGKAELRRRPLWQRSASERRRIYIAVLVDRTVAVSLAPDMQRWKKAVLYFWSWGGGQAGTRASPGGSCHLPYVLENILQLAGFDLPKVLRELYADAAVMRYRLGMLGRSSTMLHEMGVAQKSHINNQAAGIQISEITEGPGGAT
jgi:hypothetical protein